MRRIVAIYHDQRILHEYKEPVMNELITDKGELIYL